MTLARGAVLGALLAVVAVLAILVLGNGGGEKSSTMLVPVRRYGSNV